VYVFASHTDTPTERAMRKNCKRFMRQVSFAQLSLTTHVAVTINRGATIHCKCGDQSKEMWSVWLLFVFVSVFVVTGLACVVALLLLLFQRAQPKSRVSEEPNGVAVVSPDFEPPSTAFINRITDEAVERVALDHIIAEVNRTT
jgi:hypothetical protein